MDTFHLQNIRLEMSFQPLHMTLSKMSKKQVTESSIVADTHISVIEHLPGLIFPI